MQVERGDTGSHQAVPGLARGCGHDRAAGRQEPSPMIEKVESCVSEDMQDLKPLLLGYSLVPGRRRVHVKDSGTGKGLGRCPRGQSKAEPSRDAVRPSLQFAWPPSPF